MKKILINILAPALLMTAGCKKYLEQPPDQRTQLNTVEKVAELLGTAYPQADYATFTEAYSDNASDKGVNQVETEEVNTNPYYFRDVVDDQQGSPTFYWNACYNAIAAANQALETIEKAPDPEAYRAQKGEALVARAYTHFMLVTLFSKVYNPATAAQDPGIPYVTAPEKVVMGQYERKTVAYVYEQIEKDLTEGLPLINNTSYKVPKYHFTTSAAHAFATRFYLFKGDFNKVVEHANLVFAGGNIRPNLRPWVANSKLTAREMEAIYTQATQSANLLLVETISNWARNYANYRYGLSVNLVRQLFVLDNVTGASWVQPVYVSSRGEDNVLILKFREHFVRNSTNADIGTPYTIFPLLTAEEVLFNRAEAYLYLNNVEAARKDLNDYASMRIENYDPASHAITDGKLRDYYGTSNVRNGLLATLLDFKRAEFIQEGMRWFDLLRYGATVTHRGVNGQTEVLTPDDPRRLFQLPQEVKLAGIEQNPR